jgi:transposase
VRDLPYGKWKKAYLLFDKVRVECPRCGVKIEKLEWLEPWARLTKRFEEEVARECRLIQSIKDVAKRLHLGWDTVKEIDKKYLERELNPPNFTDVKCLAVDEIALRKGHKYATVISEASRCRVLWVVKDRAEKSLNSFYRELGKKGCRQIEAVVMDMWPAYEASSRKYCPKAEIIYDEFHIIQNYGKIIDKVRNMELAKADQEHKGIFKGTKYLLLSNRANVRGKKRGQLDELLQANRSLSVVYILKDDLKHLWDYRSEGWAKKWFDGWYNRAQDSGIATLIKFADSLKAHLGGILAHCRYPLNTSFLEGMNNKIKVIKRIAFGFRDMDYFFLKIRGAFRG